MRRHVLLQHIAIGALLLSILSGCSTAPASPSGPGASPSASPLGVSDRSLTPSPSAAPEGIDPERFTAAVRASVVELNNKNPGAGNFKIAEIRVTGIIGFVDITLSDTAAWSVLTDTEKKDFITTLGKELDILAVNNAYPGTLRKVGTDTMLYAPDGLALAERTSLGIVVLY